MTEDNLTDMIELCKSLYEFAILMRYFSFEQINFTQFCLRMLGWKFKNLYIEVYNFSVLAIKIHKQKDVYKTAFTSLFLFPMFFQGESSFSQLSLFICNSFLSFNMFCQFWTLAITIFHIFQSFLSSQQ